MWARVVFRLGILMIVGVFLYALFRTLLGIGAIWLFLTLMGNQTPPATPAPLPVPTVLPQGYRGILIVQAGRNGTSVPVDGEHHPLVIPDSGIVADAGLQLPVSFVYPDGTRIDFRDSNAGVSSRSYATKTQHTLQTTGTIWIIAIGSASDHQFYDQQLDPIWDKYVSEGCSPKFNLPHAFGAPANAPQPDPTSPSPP